MKYQNGTQFLSKTTTWSYLEMYINRSTLNDLIYCPVILNASKTTPICRLESTLIYYHAILNASKTSNYY